MGSKRADWRYSECQDRVEVVRGQWGLDGEERPRSEWG